MSSSSVTSRKRCYCGDIAENFTSRTPNNLVKRFYKCAKPEQDEVISVKILMVINIFKFKLDASIDEITMLNMLSNTCKLERDKLMENVDVLKAINDVEVNKARDMEVKVMQMKMFIMISFALFVEFDVALSMK
uniref:Uncharacterized protein At4g04775-like n=1 Tax=Nicotiana tabacum TaxID=4097 RepID=A0A1S3YJ43_TOBAC|nr:PREDICTED: uncharacterized protein At4g04775-like [Nicotiana tabacum]